MLYTSDAMREEKKRRVMLVSVAYAGEKGQLLCRKEQIQSERYDEERERITKESELQNRIQRREGKK